MDTTNVIMATVLAVALGWVMLSPSVDDGIVARLGMLLMVLGLGGVALRELEGTDSWIGLQASLRMIFIGGAIVLGAVAWRCGWIRKKGKS